MRWNSPDGSELMGRSRGWEALLYQTCGAAATDRCGIDLHGGCRHAGRSQRGGHRLSARQAEGQCRRLGVRIVRGGVAIAGDRDDAVAAPRGELLQRIGSRLRQRGRTGDEGDADGVGRARLEAVSPASPRPRLPAPSAPGWRPMVVARVAPAWRPLPVGVAGGGGGGAAADRWRRSRRRRGGNAGGWAGAGGGTGACATPAAWAAPAGGWHLRDGAARPLAALIAGRRERRALHRANRCLGRRRQQALVPRLAVWAGAGGASAAGMEALAVAVPGGGGGGGGGTVPRPNSARRGARQRRIGDRRRRGSVLRVGAVGDQRVGDVGQRGAVGLLPASAAPWPGSDTAGRRRAAAAALRRSCRPAGRATRSPGSSTEGTTSSRPAAAPEPPGRPARQERRPDVPESGPQISLNPISLHP